MQKVLHPQDLSESTLPLAVGDEVDRDQLAQFLQKGGYTSVRIVEERGDFSLRGAIVDVYSPLYEDPLRFEFHDDRLESIRRFEPESQRSFPQSSMDRAILLPAKDFSKDSNKPLVTLFEYFKAKGMVFIAEGEAVEKEAEVFTRLIEEHYQKALKKKGSPSPPESAYLRVDHLLSSLNRLQTVFLQDGPVAPPQCQHLFPFEMDTNEALQLEMKAALSGGVAHHEKTPFSLLLNHLREWQRKGMKVFIVSHTQGQAERLRELFLHYEVESHLEKTRRFQEVSDQSERDLTLLVGPLSSGFRNPREGEPDRRGDLR
jgi:transcription-repair coupling factor (superfamily II helicase)